MEVVRNEGMRWNGMREVRPIVMEPIDGETSVWNGMKGFCLQERRAAHEGSAGNAKEMTGWHFDYAQ